MDDKRKKQLMIGGGVAGGILLALLLWVFLKPPADDTTGDVPVAGTKTMPTAKGRPDRPPTLQGNVPAPAQSANGAPADTAAPGGKTAKPVQIAQLPGHRGDPFYYERHITPPPPNVFSDIAPITIAVENYPKEQAKPATVRVVPNRRVSGLMSGDGVYAILESTNGDVEIVKPGSKTKDGYTVAAINPDSVLLEKEDPLTHIVYTQLVMFTDQAVGSTPQSGGGRAGGARGAGGRGAAGGPLGSPGGANSPDDGG